MVLPPRLARVNRSVTNRLVRPVAERAPGFGVVVHRGRRSGRTYRTPVNVFPTASGYSITLTYGARADWVRNVQEAGGCDLVTRGRRHRLQAPVVVRDDRRSDVPVVLRPVLRAIGVEEFLRLRSGTSAGAGPAG